MIEFGGWIGAPFAPHPPFMWVPQAIGHLIEFLRLENEIVGRSLRFDRERRRPVGINPVYRKRLHLAVVDHDPVRAFKPVKDGFRVIIKVGGLIGFERRLDIDVESDV